MNRDLLERDSEWQWYQLGHMQICTSPQTDNHARIPPLNFYRPDALPPNQQHQSTEATSPNKLQHNIRIDTVGFHLSILEPKQ